MRLASIRLRNFRLFSDVTCELHPELTVLVADNGRGKTSVLDAIRILFGTYLAVFPTGKGQGITLSDVRTVELDRELPSSSTVYPVELEAWGELTPDQPNVSWSRALNTAKGGTTIKDARALTRYASLLRSNGQAQAQHGQPEDWPLLAYYGTGRLWHQSKLTNGKLFTNGYDTRSAAYRDCMEPASGFKSFMEWYAYAYRAITQSKIRFMESTPGATAQEVIAHQNAFSPLVDAVRTAVDAILRPTGWKGLWYSEVLADITMTHDQLGTMAVSRLSDGIRNSLGMAADIAFRAVQLNPHLGADAAKKARGIVLIDELDMHLHPSWQQVILTSLREAFPLIQFIVTTHSPQVLTSIDHTSIRVIREGDPSCTQTAWIDTVPLQTRGVASSSVLAQIMGVDPVPDVPEARLLEQYHALIQQNLHLQAAGLDLRTRLDAHFGTNHPVMLECDRMLRLQKYQQKLQPSPRAPDHQPG